MIVTRNETIITLAQTLEECMESLNSALVNAQNQINGLKAKVSDLAESDEDDTELARVHEHCAEQREKVELKWDRGIISVGTGVALSCKATLVDT